MERGLHTSGIKLIGIGDVVDDEVLSKMNNSLLGIVTTLQYSVAHVSEKNKVFVEDFKRATNGERPNAIEHTSHACNRNCTEGLRAPPGKVWCRQISFS